MEETHWWFTGRREIVRRLVHQVLPPGARSILMDVGCGTGGNLASFAGDYACYGWDPSDEAVRLARESHPPARFQAGDLREAFSSLPSPPDLLLVMDVLEHIQEDRSFFSQLVSALRPGGYLLLTVPAGMELWSPHDISFGHFRRYSRTQLEELWKDQPVTPRLVSHYNSRLYPIVRCVRLWTRFRGHTSGEAQTDFRLPPPWLNRALARVLSAEADVLVNQLKRNRGSGFACGVSLIALLQKGKKG